MAATHQSRTLCLPNFLSKNKNIKIYRTSTLPVDSCGCETWYPALWEEHRLRVFESGTLKNIFGPKRNKITGEWIRLHNDELHDLALLREYFTDDRIKKNEHVVCMWREVRFVPVENPEEKRPLGIPRRTREDNIKMNLKEIGREIDSSDSGYGQVLRSFEQGN